MEPCPKVPRARVAEEVFLADPPPTQGTPGSPGPRSSYGPRHRPTYAVGVPVALPAPRSGIGLAGGRATSRSSDVEGRRPGPGTVAPGRRPGASADRAVRGQRPYRTGDWRPSSGG